MKRIQQKSVHYTTLPYLLYLNSWMFSRLLISSCHLFVQQNNQNVKKMKNKTKTSIETFSAFVIFSFYFLHKQFFSAIIYEIGTTCSVRLMERDRRISRSIFLTVTMASTSDYFYFLLLLLFPNSLVAGSPLTTT